MSLALDTSGVRWICKLSLGTYSCRTAYRFVCTLLTLCFQIPPCQAAATLERKFRRDSLFCPDELDSLFSYFDTGAGSGPRSKYRERNEASVLLAHPPASSPRARAEHRTPGEASASLQRGLTLRKRDEELVAQTPTHRFYYTYYYNILSSQCLVFAF